MVTKVNNRMIDGAAVSVLDFGADPTGAIDSTPAFVSAAAECLSSGSKLVGNGTFLLSGSGTVDLKNIKVDIDGILNYTGDTSGYVVLGGNSSTTINPRQYIRQIRSDESRDETTPLCVIEGTKNQDITIDVCASVKLHAGNADNVGNTSIAYSNFYFNYVNVLNIQGAPQGTSALGGWINENTFYLKRCTKLIIGSTDTDTYLHNNNIFHGGTFEGSSTITIDGGTDNTLNSVRLENADDNAISFSSRTINNKVIISWVESFSDQPVYDWNYTDLGRGNIVFSNDGAAYSEHPVMSLSADTILFDNDATPTACNLYGVGNWTNTNEDGTPTAPYYLSKSGNDISCPTFRVIGRSPKIPISTTQDSVITVASGGWSAGGYRLIVHGYDSDGNVLAGGAEDIIAVGLPPASFGSYIQTVNQTNNRFYLKRQGCHFISIAVVNGSVANSFKWINVSVKNPKVTTRTNGAQVKLPASYAIPCNTPNLN